jgi:dihydroxy-acid dehydratase
MELTSQKMRKLAPEMDPLRIGCGWKKEDLSKPQIMIESTSGDSHPGSAHLPILVERREEVSSTQADSARVTPVQISATARARERTESISLWQAGR